MNYKLSPNDSVDADGFIYAENERNANNLCVQFAEEILNIFNAFQDEGRVNVYPIEEPNIFWNPHYLTA